MYILMLVTSMLMLLALLTYGRIESFRGFSFVQSQFEEYMEKTEREYPNEQAIKRYKKTVATEQESVEKTEEKNPASSKLSFRLFVDMNERLVKPKEFEQNTKIGKNLIHILYNGQPFYEKIEQKRPNFVDEIFAAIMRETDLLTDKQKITKAKELANIDLKDAELNDAFTKMLKGNELLEDGYLSLLDFITMKKNKLQIRVFLASKPLLLALFGSPSLVEEIIAERYDLYRQLLNTEFRGNFKHTGSEEFKEKFLDSRLPYVNVETIDFGISLTNPRNYN